MKKLFLIIGLLTLNACAPLAENDDEGACDVPDSTYVAAYTETWQNVQYSLPRCWTATDNTSNLWLTDDESESYVRMTFSSEENEETNKSSKEFQAPNGETLYLYYRTEDFQDAQVQEILYSIQFTTP